MWGRVDCFKQVFVVCDCCCNYCAGNQLQQQQQQLLLVLRVGEWNQFCEGVFFQIKLKEKIGFALTSNSLLISSCEKEKYMKRFLKE